MGTPPIMDYAQAICALSLVFVLPFLDLGPVRRLKQRASSAARLAFYHRVCLILWGALAVVLALAGPGKLFAAPGQLNDAAWFAGHGWVYALAVSITTAYFALALVPGVQCVLNKRVRAKYGKAMGSLRYLLPVSDVERRWWVLLSISAGVCEEFLFRGFLLGYLSGHLAGGPQLGLTLAWLLSSLAFGFGHLYQGTAGIARTTVAGLVFGLVAILTGNLALPILLHCLVDLQALVMYRPALDAPDEVVALIAGRSDDADAAAQAR